MKEVLLHAYVIGYDMTNGVVLIEDTDISNQLVLPQSIFIEKPGFVLSSKNWDFISHGMYKHKKTGKYFEIPDENFHNTGVITFKDSDYLHDDFMIGDAILSKYIWIESLLDHLTFITLHGIIVEDKVHTETSTLVEFNHYTKNKINETQSKLFPEIPLIWNIRILVPNEFLHKDPGTTSHDNAILFGH